MSFRFFSGNIFLQQFLCLWYFRFILVSDLTVGVVAGDDSDRFSEREFLTDEGVDDLLVHSGTHDDGTAAVPYYGDPNYKSASVGDFTDADPYCDSIGCHIPHAVDHVQFRLMGLFWAGQPKYISRPPESICEAVFENPVDAYSNGIANQTSILSSITRHLHAPGFSQMALSPVRRLVYGKNNECAKGRQSLYQGSADAVSQRSSPQTEEEESEFMEINGVSKEQGGVFEGDADSGADQCHQPTVEAFSMDHMVFGSYGSWYSMLLFGRLLKIGETCYEVLTQFSELTEGWVQRKAQSVMDSFSMTIEKTCAGGGFEPQDLSACVNPVSEIDQAHHQASNRLTDTVRDTRHRRYLQGLGARWQRFLFDQDDVVKCGDLKKGDVDGLVEISGETRLSSQERADRLDIFQKAHFYNKYPRVKASLCLAESHHGMIRQLDYDGQFEVSVIGSTLYSGGKLEVALFVGASDKDSCVLADGQRTFSTIPLSYFARWSCEYSDGSITMSQPAAAVSYSSAVAIISCNVGDNTDEIPTVSLAARHLKWRVDLPLCKAPFDGGGVDDVAKIPRFAASQVANQPTECCSYSDYFSENPEQKIGSKREKSSGLSRIEELKSILDRLKKEKDMGSHPELYTRRRTMTLCSQVLYKLDSQRAQRLVREWIYYHYLIGIRHFVFYDRDGSLEEVMRPFLQKGEKNSWTAFVSVEYYPAFSLSHMGRKHHYVHSKLGLPSHAAPDATAAAHCIWSQRGQSEWVAMLHAPDEYLSNTHGMRHIEEILTPMRELQIDILDVSQVYFLNKTRESDALLGQYVHRANEPLLQPFGWGSRLFANSFLNRFGSPLARPEAVSELVAAHYARANNLFFSARILDETGQDFARANHYGHAFGSRNPLDPENYLVPDDSLLWAEQIMSEMDNT